MDLTGARYFLQKTISNFYTKKHDCRISWEQICWIDIHVKLFITKFMTTVCWRSDKQKGHVDNSKLVVCHAIPCRGGGLSICVCGGGSYEFYTLIFFLHWQFLKLTALRVCHINLVKLIAKTVVSCRKCKKMFCLTSFIFWPIKGVCSTLHMLVRVGHEVQENLVCAGLELLCKHKPNTEEKNLAGKTPLFMAVEDQSLKALNLLVR